ncbi:predicted protein [Chaetoceros tenuissimus]|uniref:Uncharacterized protein n=1 Tax=Chaetoceros tenuissimus TaxID=426638 RepID=A0AAD3CIR6_9STRA|nr:predicted protein [Chaetoceros tenuissimus]
MSSSKSTTSSGRASLERIIKTDSSRALLPRENGTNRGRTLDRNDDDSDSDIEFVGVENEADKTMATKTPIKLEKENNALRRSVRSKPHNRPSSRRDLFDDKDSSDEDESSSSVPSSRKRQQDSVNYNDDEDDDKIEKILTEDNNAFWEEKRNEKSKMSNTGANKKRKVSQSRLKVPDVFLNVDEKKQVNGGETFMLTVLKKAENIGFSETFAYGKWKKFQNQILEEEFGTGGIFEDYEQPTNAQTFRAKLATAKKILDELCRDNSKCPKHIEKCLEVYMRINGKGNVASRRNSNHESEEENNTNEVEQGKSSNESSTDSSDPISEQIVEVLNHYDKTGSPSDGKHKEHESIDSKDSTQASGDDSALSKAKRLLKFYEDQRMKAQEQYRLENDNELKQIFLDDIRSIKNKIDDLNQSLL